MAKTTVEVKQYKRKDGTVVRGSTRKLTKAEKLKRKQSLGSHLKKGAKIGAAIGGTLGAISGGTVGGALGGPAGALSLGGLAATEGAVKGGLAGGTIGSGVYGVKRAMAKRRDPKGFKKSFDYSRNTEDVKMFIGQQDESSINFARPKGAKDKTPRKKQVPGQTGPSIRKDAKTGVKIGAGVGGASGALQGAAAGAILGKTRKAKALGAIGGALGGAAAGAIGGGIQGGVIGAGVGAARKGASALNRRKQAQELRDQSRKFRN